MDKTYTLEIKKGVLFIRFFKDPDASDIISVVDDFCRVDESDRRLWDFSRVNLNFSNEELYQIAEYSKSTHSQAFKSAIVVANDLSFGLSRMYGTFRDDASAQTHVYRNEEEALQWLLGDIKTE